MKDRPREITGNMVKRMYDHSLKTTGRLPQAKEVRQMEKKAALVATKASRDSKK